MPYRTDNIALGSVFLKRSAKLLPCQKEMVKYWHERGMSINGIARMFKVNKRLIQFILFPERHKKNLQDRKARGGSKIYYQKEHHTKAMRDHRRRKYKILKSITNNKNENT